MQTRELFFNGKSLDLSDATKIGVTLQANNLGELQNRQGEFTNTFKIPKTLRNRNILDHLDNISSVSVIPYRQNVVRYLEDGVEIIPEGTGTVESSDELYYHIKVTAGNLEFFNKFPDVKIYELDWTNQIHVRDFWTIKDSRTNTSGYIYPLINWFDSDNTTAFNTNEINTRYLYPCMFLKDIFNKVDEVTGYTSKGSFIDWLETNEVILSPKDSKMTQSAADGFKSSAKNTSEQFLGEGGNTTIGQSITNPQFDVVTNEFDNYTLENTKEIYGYFKYKGTFKIFSNSDTSLGRSVGVRIRIINTTTSAVVSNTLYPQFVPPGPITIFQEFIVDFELITANLNLDAATNYSIQFELLDPATDSAFDYYTNFYLLKNSKLEFLPVLENPYGSTVQFGNLFDLKIKEIYKDVMNWKGLMVQTNPLKKEVYFDFFETIETFLPYAKDWSNKVDIDTIKTNYSFGKYAQRNNFKFKESETITIGFNDVFFNIDDFTLEDEATVIQMVTSATESEIKFNENEIPRIESVSLGGKFTATNYRLLILNRKNQPVRYFDNTQTQTHNNSIPFCTPIQFDLENDYGILQQILNRAKVIKVKMKLNEVDLKMFQRFDLPTKQMAFLQPISLSIQTEKMNLNGYFYVNKIENIQGGFGTAELIKI